MQTILVIEDEEDIADLIAFNLKRNDFHVANGGSDSRITVRCG